MAVNCPIHESGWPCKVIGEALVLRRNNIYFSASLEGLGKVHAWGYMIMTTHRLVFVSDKYAESPKSELRSFDLPLGNIFKEQFLQPVFGANYLKGFCRPLMGLLPSNTTFEIHFYEGG